MVHPLLDIETCSGPLEKREIIFDLRSKGAIKKANILELISAASVSQNKIFELNEPSGH